VLALVPLQMAVFLIWPLPSGVTDWFALFQRSRLVGLVDMDLLLIVDNVLLVLMFLALYAALRRASKSFMTIAMTLELMAVTAYFASNTAFEMLALSNQHAAATTEAQRAVLEAAGQAMLVTWQGTAFNVGYVLGALAVIVASSVMLRSRVFSKATAYFGLMFGLLNVVPASAGKLGLVLSILSLVPMWVWLVLIARRLFQLGPGIPAEAPGGSSKAGEPWGKLQHQR
jgi:hypothetical protein